MNAPTATPIAQAVAELVKPQEVIAAERQAQAAIDGARLLVIDSREGYEAAADDLQSLKDRFRAVEGQRVHLKEPFLEGGRRVDAFFKGPLDRLKEAADIVSRGMLDYDRREQERLRKEREEADRKERERQAEVRRQQEEADRAAREAAQSQAAAAAAAQAAAAAAQAATDTAAQEAAQAAAAAAEAAAAEAAAATQAAQAQAVQVQDTVDLLAVTPAAPVATSQARAAGTSTVRTWKAVSIDLRELVLGAAKAIQDGSERADEMLSYLQANESALNATAKGLKGAARVPGVLFGEAASIRATSRGKGRAG